MTRAGQIAPAGLVRVVSACRRSKGIGCQSQPAGKQSPSPHGSAVNPSRAINPSGTAVNPSRAINPSGTRLVRDAVPTSSHPSDPTPPNPAAIYTALGPTSFSRQNKLPTGEDLEPYKHRRPTRKMLFLPLAILAGSAAASSFIAYEGDCKTPGDQVGNIEFNVLSSNWRSGCNIIPTGTGRSFALWNIPVSAIFSTCLAQVYHDNRCGGGEKTLFVRNLAACNDYNGIYSMKIVCT